MASTTAPLDLSNSRPTALNIATIRYITQYETEYEPL